ncbi:hypothetical protein MPSEU_000565000 [Mayamaea pseudoterrestris]|nr:hypothetical protein MPSEU_000565000 [Mayamaea pseudoterrestris]
MRPCGRMRCASNNDDRTTMDFKPEHVHYDIVEKWIRDGIKESHDAYFDVNRFDIELQRIEDKFIFHHKSLVSFVRNCMVPHIKRTSPKVKANLSKYIEQYIQGRTILSLAKEANYSPHLFSRYLVEALTQFKSKKLTDALRNPEVHLVDANVFQEKYRLSQITSNRLAREVLEAQQADPLHGPRAEVQRHMLGIEFECVLEYQLRQIGIGFDTEDQLRKIGTSRTPDVLLASPLAVRVPCKKCTGYEWKVICWIDSKALYGDIWTHNTSIISQAES